MMRPTSGMCQSGKTVSSLFPSSFLLPDGWNAEGLFDVQASMWDLGVTLGKESMHRSHIGLVGPP